MLHSAGSPEFIQYDSLQTGDELEGTTDIGIPDITRCPLCVRSGFACERGLIAGRPGALGAVFCSAFPPTA